MCIASSLHCSGVDFDGTSTKILVLDFMIKSVISKRIFERIIYILIVINLFAMILESEPNLDSKFRVIL